MARYVVTLDAYIFAEDDEQAKQFAHEYALYLDGCEGHEDNRASVIALCEQPFGTLTHRDIDYNL